MGIGMLTSVSDLPAGIDPRLWIRTNVGCLDYLYDAARTRPGRMEAYCPDEHQSYAVCKHEILAMSEESAMWVDGFLAGNAPPIDVMFGPSIYGEDVDFDDPRWGRWRRAIASFRADGRWLPKPWFDLPDLPSDMSFAVAPCALIADEYWMWEHGHWQQQPPPPLIPGHLLVDTICYQRRHHDTDYESPVGDVVTCHDCGLIMPP